MRGRNAPSWGEIIIMALVGQQEIKCLPAHAVGKCQLREVRASESRGLLVHPQALRAQRLHYSKSPGKNSKHSSANVAGKFQQVEVLQRDFLRSAGCTADARAGALGQRHEPTGCEHARQQGHAAPGPHQCGESNSGSHAGGRRGLGKCPELAPFGDTPSQNKLQQRSPTARCSPCVSFWFVTAPVGPVPCAPAGHVVSLSDLELS